MKKRATTQDERRLFESAIAASRPAKIPPQPPKRRPEKFRTRNGADAPEARLDLHGLTEDAAHGALLAFLRGARKQGLRLVLVITGKGSAHARAFDAPYDMELDRRARGILKAAVPRWLHEKEFSALVSEIRSASRRLGGDGALMLILRKPR